MNNKIVEERRECLKEEIKANDIQAASNGLLKTIKCPKQIGMISAGLPAANYSPPIYSGKAKLILKGSGMGQHSIEFGNDYSVENQENININQTYEGTPVITKQKLILPPIIHGAPSVKKYIPSSIDYKPPAYRPYIPQNILNLHGLT